MFAVDDGIWAGNLDAADVLFLIAAVVFGIAAVLPHTIRRSEGARLDLGVSLVPAGLCLLAIAWLIL
jgi:hypothetical protein